MKGETMTDLPTIQPGPTVTLVDGAHAIWQGYTRTHPRLGYTFWVVRHRGVDKGIPANMIIGPRETETETHPNRVRII